jgi:uncharacterized circularly permuted ATP-grasp superfamily protein
MNCNIIWQGYLYLLCFCFAPWISAHHAYANNNLYDDIIPTELSSSLWTFSIKFNFVRRLRLLCFFFFGIIGYNFILLSGIIPDYFINNNFNYFIGHVHTDIKNWKDAIDS